MHGLKLQKLRRKHGHESIAALFPLETVNIYCAPCPFAINTALAICKINSTLEVAYRVRVDCRLGATCCGREDGEHRIDATKVVVDAIKQAEWNLPSLLKRDERERYELLVNSIDRLWTEQTLHDVLSEADYDTVMKNGLEKDPKEESVMNGDDSAECGDETDDDNNMAGGNDVDEDDNTEWGRVLFPDPRGYQRSTENDDDRFAVFLLEPSYTGLLDDAFEEINPVVGEMFNGHGSGRDVQSGFVGTFVFRGFEPIY